MNRFRVILIAATGLIAALVAALVVLPLNVPAIGWLFGSAVSFEEEAVLLKRLKAPAGYRINVFATGIGDARLMQLTPGGDLIVTSSDTGEVVLVERDADGDGRGDGTRVIASGRQDPHGIWLDGSALYIAEEHQVIRYRFDPEARGLAEKTVVLEGLPHDGGHHTRTIKKGPDGWFYVSIGSSCNVCIEEHPWRAAIVRFRPGEAEPELYASGLRNTVGFDWQPGTGDMYGVNNGRDWLGDDFPPEELNLIVKGGFYGWPYFNADNVPDEDHGSDPKAATLDPIPPVYGFTAHVAPLSITFLEHQDGTALEGAALVAQHGSWNRSEKAGYRVVSLHWDADGAISQETFIDGFELDDDVIGRPVDIVEAGDGTLYISDDYAGVVYRVTRAD